MKKLCKKLTAILLALCMLSSVNLWIFANSDPPIYTYTNTDAATLKPILNEYISTEQESDVFYKQSCKLSTGEQGFCHIGYDKDAKAFYVQFIDSTINPSFSWSYKYDTDYTWKYKTNHSNDTNWIEVDSFGIEFIGRTYNYGNPLNLESLDERCQSLFKVNDGSFLSTVNYTYKIRSGNELDCFLDDDIDGDIIYAYAKFDFESEPFYCKIYSNDNSIFIDRFVNGRFEPYYEYCKGVKEWCNVKDDSYVDEIYLRLNYIRSVANADALNRILKCLNKPYYPVNNNRLNFTRVNTYLGGKTYYKIYSGYIELSTGETGLGIIGWSLQTGCFYIQMQTNNPDGKWSYKFTEFDGTPKWKYRDITSDDDFADIDQFYIKFYDYSTGKYIECPSKLSFMFSDGDLLDSDTRFLEDGVYKIKNVYNGLYLDVTDGGATSGTPIQQWSGTSTDNNFNQLFKITYVDTLQGLDYYSVRPMTNSGLGLYSSVSYTPSSVSVRNMTYVDDTSIPYTHLWAINKSGNIYTIKNGMADVSSYLSTPLNSTNGSQITTSDSISTNSQWRFEAYTGDDLDAVVASSVSYDLICGATFDYDVYMYSSKIHINGPVRYSVSNTDGSATDKATIDPLTGELTALKSGQIRLEVRYTDSPYCYWYWIVTIHGIDEGVYFIQNVGTKRYIDIEGPLTTYEAIIQQWDLHTKNQEKWIVEHASDAAGYCRIKSIFSNLYIGVDPNDTSLIRQYSEKNNYTLWQFEKTSSGNIRLICKATESFEKALAVPLSYDYNGTDLTQLKHTDNTNCRDEWAFYKVKYNATVNNFYDHGYHVRYGETESVATEAIQSYNIAVAEQYLKIFGLAVSINDTEYFNSNIDICKGTVSNNNIDTLCSHIANHTNRDSVIRNFKSHHNGNDTTTSVLWSCHKIVSTASSGKQDYNRSCSSGACVYLLEISDILRTRDSQGILMHELNHQYGANDHYHELAVEGDSSTCKFKDTCSICGTNPRPSSCIMNYSRTDINSSTVICSECISDIILHLESHH